MSDQPDHDQTRTLSRVDLPRLVVRCAAYNARHGTDYTPETYDEERTRVGRVIAYDEGWEDSGADTARELLAEIVAQYDAAPDGPLGKGFTNGPFLRARQFLGSSHNDRQQASPPCGPENTTQS